VNQLKRESANKETDNACRDCDRGSVTVIIKDPMLWVCGGGGAGSTLEGGGDGGNVIRPLLLGQHPVKLSRPQRPMPHTPPHAHKGRDDCVLQISTCTLKKRERRSTFLPSPPPPLPPPSLHACHSVPVHGRIEHGLRRAHQVPVPPSAPRHPTPATPVPSDNTTNLNIEPSM
jgi:hypothetical protein